MYHQTRQPWGALLALAATAALCTFLAGPAEANDKPPAPPPATKPADSWSGSDKKMHLGVSFVLGMATGAQWPDNKPLAFGVAMIPGLLKEASDAGKGGTGFSAKDLVANAVGVALGITTVHFLVKRDNGTTTVAYTTSF